MLKFILNLSFHGCLFLREFDFITLKLIRFNWLHTFLNEIHVASTVNASKYGFEGFLISLWLTEFQ